jgi:hypothetical protein
MISFTKKKGSQIFGVFKNQPLQHSMVCFFEFLTPFILGGHNYLNFIPFLTIFSAPYLPIKRVQIFFGHQKQQSPPLGSCLP